MPITPRMLLGDSPNSFKYLSSSVNKPHMWPPAECPAASNTCQEHILVTSGGKPTQEYLVFVTTESLCVLPQPEMEENAQHLFHWLQVGTNDTQQQYPAHGQGALQAISVWGIACIELLLWQLLIQVKHRARVTHVAIPLLAKVLPM